VLVTGASGFLGRALCEEFLPGGYSERATFRNLLFKLSPGVDYCVIGDLTEDVELV
jgi:nucleoside-diphosphate-sugar epimerase